MAVSINLIRYIHNIGNHKHEILKKNHKIQQKKYESGNHKLISLWLISPEKIS